MASEGIEIDPDLLEEDGVESDSISGASSGLEDNDEEDAYIDEEDGDILTRPVEDDAVFSRLTGLVTQPGSGAMSLEDQMILAETEEMEEELPRTRSSARKRASKARTQHKPSHEVQRLLGQANMAYAQGDSQRTIDLFLEVIRFDPYVIAAWNTLATVYDEMGNQEASRSMRFFAAHVEDEADTWRELALEFKSLGQLGQCVHCLRKALRKEPDDVSMLFELAGIYRQQGFTSKAADTFNRLIKSHKPAGTDFNFLSQLHSTLLALEAVDIAASAYRVAFDHHLSRLSPTDPTSTMQLEHIVSLADDLLLLDELEECLGIIRRGQRWLQGRKDEIHWDSMDDDREYDPAGTRRGEEGEEAESEGFKLETHLRHRLALVRLRLGDDEEAMIHVDEILGLDVVQYSDLFMDLGNALIKREMWEKAMECFATIQECEALPDTTTLIYNIAVCHQNLKEFPSALEAFQWVAEEDESNLEARVRMANVLDELGRKPEALEVITEVIKARATNKDSGKGPRGRGKALTKSEKAGQRKLTKRVLEEQMKSTMQSLWADVRAAEEGIANGAIEALDNFIDAAGTMVENFRLAKSNFNKSRGVTRVPKTAKKRAKNDLTSEALALQDRLERAMGFEDAQEEQGTKYLVVRQSSFYGLDCEEWLSLIVKYCCVLMVKAEEDVALDILEHVIWSGLFNNRRSEVVLRMTIITCCMRTRAYEKIVDNARRLAQIHQFRNEPFHICLAACGGGGTKASAALQNLQFQKFLHRELRIHDDVVKGRKLNYSAIMNRWTTVLKAGVNRMPGEEAEGDDDDAEEVAVEEGRESEEAAPKPTKVSAVLNVLYGQHMLGAKAYQSALFYLLRAYELVPEDAYISLLIAQCYLGRAGNRQADNRNNYVVQAMAFLSRYRKLSLKDAETQEQVDYNFGRGFHGVGVMHLAVEHYEKVLTSIQTRMDASPEPELVRSASLACEAAHNLVIIYSMNGSVELAREKSKWLAI